MKNKNLILAILGIFLLGLGVINNNLSNTLFPTETIFYENRADLISSGFWNLTESPILIDDTDPSKNWSYTASHYAWCSGFGTSEAPYVVENVTIDGQGVGSCIEIRNSTAFFIIKNCTVYNSGSNYLEDGGIELNNVKNGHISENNCSNNQDHGILLTTNCSNVIITNNTILNTVYGIDLLYGCYNNTVSFNCGECSIRLSGCFNNIISNNNIFGVGSWIGLRDNSSYNLITKNELYGGGYTAIEVTSNSNYNIIKNNTIKDRLSTAICISVCRDNIICENTIRNIDDDFVGFALHGGIILTSVNNTLISNNIVANTEQSGIIAYGNNNTIEGNEILNNSWYGINTAGIDNTISKNSIVQNKMGILADGLNIVINENYITLSMRHGILSREGTCNIFGNIIISNAYSSLTEGIGLIHCNNSLIWNNILTDNRGGGIFLEHLCYYNAVYENNITGIRKNDDYGIKLFRSNNNNISRNILTNHCVALYLERSNYNNVIENVMIQNLKCIEEIDCIENLYRDNSCDLDVIQPAIPGFDIYYLIGILFLFAVVSVIRKLNRKN